jgi:hypothetical protein
MTAQTQTPITFTATEHSIDAFVAYRTREEADEVAALFPKSTKVRVVGCSTYVSYWSTRSDPPLLLRGGYDHLAPEGAKPGDEFTVYQVRIQVNLYSTGVTGDVNEGGLKRWASFKRAAAKHGLALAYNADAYTNSLSAEQAAAL